MPSTEDLDEMNIEIMRNTLYKAYLDDFAAFCNKLGGTTGEVMGNLLAFEVAFFLLYWWFALERGLCYSVHGCLWVEVCYPRLTCVNQQLSGGFW
jgi:hypothetical protein